MAVAKIDCPECGATLKPAKPLTPGKKVRCPKCANVFVVPGAEDEEEEVPARKTKATAGKVSRKSPPAEEPPPPPKKPLDDEDEGGVYGLLDGPDEEKEEEEEDRKPKVEYAPDLSVKNPRGPATATLAVPSNGILGFGALLALLSAVVLCASIWPFLFTKWNSGVLPSEAKRKYEKDHPRKGEMENKKSGKQEEVSSFINEDEVMEEIMKPENKAIRTQWDDMVEADRTARLLAAGGCVAAIVFFIVMAFAGVKMQNLESPLWSWTASIMAMICIVGLPLGLWSFLANEDDSSFTGLLGLLLGMITAGAFPFGLWSAFLLKKPEIEEAFRYEPE